MKLRVKDAITYYRSSGLAAVAANVDADGYILLNQLNPGETSEFIAFGGYYSPTTYSDPDVRAFSDRGVLPVSFVTLKPSLASQLWGQLLPLLFILLFVGSLVWMIIGIAQALIKKETPVVDKKPKNRPSSKARSEQGSGSKRKNNVVEAFPKDGS